MPQPNRFKIVVTGSQESGKTSLLSRIIDNIFNPNYVRTAGVDPRTMDRSALNSNTDTSNVTANTDDTFILWELGGDENLRNIITKYYAGAHAAILVTDFSLWGNALSSETINEKKRVINIIQEIRDHTANDIPIYIIGTKQDLAKEKNIEKFAHNNLITCATDQGILYNQIFITNSKYQISTDDESDHFKSPDTILDIIFTQCQKLKSAEAKTQAKPNGEQGQMELIPTDEDNVASLKSRFAGMVCGAIVGALMGLLIHNPVTCFLAAWRTTDWAEWNIPNVFRVFIFAPIINPLVAMGYGFISGGATGAEWGVTELLQIPIDMAEPFKLRTIITGSALSIFIGAAVVVAVLHLIPLALPIILGVAGAGALVFGIGYEGVDSLLTDNELQETIKNRPHSKPLLAENELQEIPKSIPAAKLSLAVEVDRSSLESQARSRSFARTIANNRNQNDVMVVNPYEKAHNARSWRSWFQVPPAAPATLIDSQRPDHFFQVSRP